MLNPIDQGILLLCMHLDGDKETGAQPLSASEWTALAKKLHRAGLSPKDFLDFGDEDYYMLLEGKADEINRYKKLIARGNRLSSELTRINEIGISVITRADERYPKSFKSKLGNLTPTLLFVAGNTDLLGKPLIGVIGSKDIDENDKEMIQTLAKGIKKAGYVLISGGQTGVDNYAEQSMLDVGGDVVSIISNSLINRIRNRETREELIKGTLLLVSPYGYNELVSVSNMLMRNLVLLELSTKTIVPKMKANDDVYYPLFTKNGTDIQRKVIAIESIAKKSAMNDIIDKFTLPSVSRQHVYDQGGNIEAVLCSDRDLDNKSIAKVTRVIKQQLDFEAGTLMDSEPKDLGVIKKNRKGEN